MAETDLRARVEALQKQVQILTGTHPAVPFTHVEYMYPPAS
jgi:hypothetical protein